MDFKKLKDILNKPTLDKSVNTIGIPDYVNSIYAPYLIRNTEEDTVNDLMKHGYNTDSPVNFIEKYKKDIGTTSWPIEESDKYPMPVTDPSTHKIYLPKGSLDNFDSQRTEIPSATTLLHELGHARMFDKNPQTRIREEEFSDNSDVLPRTNINPYETNEIIPTTNIKDSLVSNMGKISGGHHNVGTYSYPTQEALEALLIKLQGKMKNGL